MIERPAGAPHIHFAVRVPGRDPFVTQMYVEGAPENTRDGLLNRINPGARSSLIVPFRPSDVPGATLKARFDVVLSWARKLQMETLMICHPWQSQRVIGQRGFRNLYIFYRLGDQKWRHVHVSRETPISRRVGQGHIGCASGRP
jgi:hypothetical protein